MSLEYGYDDWFDNYIQYIEKKLLPKNTQWINSTMRSSSFQTERRLVVWCLVTNDTLECTSVILCLKVPCNWIIMYRGSCISIEWRCFSLHNDLKLVPLSSNANFHSVNCLFIMAPVVLLMVYNSLCSHYHVQFGIHYQISWFHFF